MVLADVGTVNFFIEGRLSFPEQVCVLFIGFVTYGT